MMGTTTRKSRRKLSPEAQTPTNRSPASCGLGEGGEGEGATKANLKIRFSFHRHEHEDRLETGNFRGARLDAEGLNN